MFRVIGIFGKLILKILRLSGKGGSALPGLIIEKIYPNFLNKFSGKLPNKPILITGTNGKTTTTKIISTIYHEAGYRVLTNRTGSNFTRGIISSVVDHMSWTGALPFDIAILEVDEVYSPAIAEALSPRALCVLNVFRDQLDRFGELDSMVARIAKAAHHSEMTVINADDPNLSVVFDEAKKLIQFGADASLQSLLPSDPHIVKLIDKNIAATDYVLKTVHQETDSQTIKVQTPTGVYELETLLLGVHNAINLTAAIAIAENVGSIKAKVIKDTISRVRPAFGRGESILFHDSHVNLLLVKNPAGFNQIIRSLSSENTDYLAISINDKIADGRDVSWLWDAEINLLAGLVPKKIVTSGTRAKDMALRLKYENLDCVIHETVNNLLNDIKHSGYKNVVIIATYTAMLQIRQALKGEVEMEDFWK